MMLSAWELSVVESVGARLHILELRHLEEVAVRVEFLHRLVE